MPSKDNPFTKGLKIIKVVIISTSAVIAESIKNFFSITLPASFKIFFSQSTVESIKRFMSKINTDINKYYKTHKHRGFNKPRVYKLRGYTTTSRVDKKVRAEQNQRLLRNFLVAAVFVLVIAILLIIFNPLKDLKEFFRMIGL